MTSYIVHVEATVYGCAYIEEADSKEDAKRLTTARNVKIEGPIYEIEVVGVDEA